MAAQGVDTVVERRVRSLGGLGRKRAGHEPGLEQPFGFEEPGERVGRRKLSSVQQREAFLRAEDERSETSFGQRLIRGAAYASHEDIPDPDHGGSHVGQRRQVAGRADRSLRRHDRRQPLRQHCFQQRRGGRTNARGALGEACEL